MTEDDRRRVPAATYRLQVHAGFRLDDAAEVADYLADLGVTHAYSSPLLRSAKGSNHGYDTVDHAHIDEARGGRDGFDRFVAALHEHGLGIREMDERGEYVTDDHFYLAYNASHEPIEFTLPSDDYARAWTPVLDTAEMSDVEPAEVKPGETVTVQGRSIVVLTGPAQ